MNPGQKYLRPEFNLRIRKLGIVHLAGGVCHKSQLFSVSRKGKKITREKGIKANICWGCFSACRTVFAATAYGMRLMDILWG